MARSENADKTLAAARKLHTEGITRYTTYQLAEKILSQPSTRFEISHGSLQRSLSELVREGTLRFSWTPRQPESHGIQLRTRHYRLAQPYQHEY